MPPSKCPLSRDNLGKTESSFLKTFGSNKKAANHSRAFGNGIHIQSHHFGSSLSCANPASTRKDCTKTRQSVSDSKQSQPRLRQAGCINQITLAAERPPLLLRSSTKRGCQSACTGLGSPRSVRTDERNPPRSLSSFPLSQSRFCIHFSFVLSATAQYKEYLFETDHFRNNDLTN